MAIEVRIPTILPAVAGGAFAFAAAAALAGNR